VTSYQLKGYLVRPIGIDSIRNIAMHSRSVLALPENPIDMSYFLEYLFKFGITYDIIDDSEMPGFLSHSEACCIPERATIYLTSETYKKACKNDPRTRFTIFHELGHLILMHSRDFHRDQNIYEIKPKPFMDSEWQANQFAAEILMPLEIILREELKTPFEIASKFGVSTQAALTRYNQLKKRNEI